MFSVEKSGARMEGLGADISPTLNLRWEFIKENKKVGKQENKNSTKKAIKKTRKQELDQEKKKKKNFS